jgi:nucleoside-diphosphate-sugar epimerase
MASNSKRILVTGAAGLIGRELCKQLLAQGHTVVGIDNNQRFPDYVPEFSYLQEDIITYISSLPNDFDYIYHMAAINGTTAFYDFPNQVLINNTLADLVVFRYAETNLNCKLIYAGSSEVIAGSERIPTAETSNITIENIHNPRWSYRLPKVLAENYLANSSINYLIVRFFNVFSENAGKGHFVRDIIDKMNCGVFELEGADETRAFCYVTDAIDALINIVDSANNEVINIGSEEEITVLTAADIIANELGFKDHTWINKTGREGSSKRRCPDITKLKQYYPSFSPRTFANAIKLIKEEL